MGNYVGNGSYDADIYILETTDPVLGGDAGELNMAAKNLANRTEYLKKNEIGKIATFAMETPPDGWAICDFEEVDRVGIYADLFALIGIRFGQEITAGDIATDIFTVLGHGYSTGDAVNIQNFYPNDANFSVQIGGVQILPTETLYLRALSANTFSIHPTATDATNNTNPANILVFDNAQNYPVIELVGKFRLPNMQQVTVKGYRYDTPETRQIGAIVADIATGANFNSMMLNYCIKYA